MMNLLIVLLIAVLFALWNGLVIKWYLTKDQKYSTYWHIVGYFIRAIPLYYIYPNILWMLIYTNIACTLYDMVINKINGWNLFYIGKTSTFDSVFGKWLYICKVVLLVTTIIILIYKLSIDAIV